MSSRGIDIQVLPEGADLRGSSYALTPEISAFLGQIADVHVMTIRPGHERGDHYHEGKNEILIVHYWDHWELDWDDGADMPRRTVEVDGDGTAMIRIPAGCWHRVRN